jgi:hypothetical protein
MELLESQLPIWACELDSSDSRARLDNNWYSPAAYFAKAEVERAVQGGTFIIKPLEEVCEPGGVITGGSPDADGEIGIIEGRNLRPNYIIPVFMKFANAPTELIISDLLIGKDGEPGTVAVVTGTFLEYCGGGVAIGNHVYRLRLAERYRSAAAFMSAFLNSRIGQALLRKRIAGGTTPTIRKADILGVEVLIPADLRSPPEVESAIIERQKRVLESMDNLGPSKGIAALAGMSDIPAALPTNWAGGGATRSSRILR